MIWFDELIRVGQLSMTVRAWNCLASAGFNTDDPIEKLLSLSESQLLKIRGFGKDTLDQIKKELEVYGLKLSPFYNLNHIKYKCWKCGEFLLASKEP